LWALHDRLEEHVTEETCKAEIESFLARGQLVPALGRALRGDPDYDVELIYGARRLFVARHVNKPLLVELQELTDHEAILAMHIENRQRLDISPYERGLSYVSWLRAGGFASQGELARALGISTSQVSRLCRLAGLPAVVVGAFRNPAEIREEWGLQLLEMLADRLRRDALIHVARRITAQLPRPPAAEVFKRLLAVHKRSRGVKVRTRDEVVRDEEGTPAFRIRQLRNELAVFLPLQNASPERLREIRRAILHVLHDSRTRGTGSDIDANPSQLNGH